MAFFRNLYCCTNKPHDMKPLALAILLVFTGSLPQPTSAQSASITFKASLKSNDNTRLSDVYVRIYGPDNNVAIDSLFTDEQGNIELQLPFSWSGTPLLPPAIAANSIVTPMSPNVLSASTGAPAITYEYPSGAQLFFNDVQGRRHENGAWLPPGFYFYYLSFDDGTRSNMQKMLLTEFCPVNVELRNRYKGYSGWRGHIGPDVSPGGESRQQVAAAGDNRQLHGAHDAADLLKHAPLEELFYAEFTRDGYVTLRDTIDIDGAVVEKTYTMQAADAPTALFSWSGELVTGSPVMFDASGSSGAYDEALVCTWDFGDGKKGQSAAMPHIFVAPGSYDVELTVSGKFGVTHQVAQTVTITASQEATHFNGTVIGSISDMDGMDLKDVRITLVEDGQEVSTDQRGLAELENLPVGIPLHFRITREGYVTQVAELTIPATTSEAVFFSSLMERAAAVTLNHAEFGGTKTGTDGASFSLPVNALVKEDGSAVKGDVQLSITPVDVAYDAAAFPGAFVGYRSDGEDGVLLSYGVAEFHIEQDGEVLQLAAGKKATLLIPVYTSGASVGDEIPLWSVDEESGTWVEEGTGTIVASAASPTGLAFQAEIGHLSWWNCDEWEDDKRRDGLCYILECTSAICVRVKVGCWVSGAMRDKKKSVSNLEPASQEDHIVLETNGFPDDIYGGTAGQNMAARDDIPPVFEVREFIPETGKNLRFPTTRDVLLDARAFGPGNQLLGGRYIVEADNLSDSFAVELVPLAVGDTIDLSINSIEEFYLDPGEVATFRVEISERASYRIYAEPGESPPLYGIFSVFQDEGSLMNGDIGTQEHWVEALPGTLYISVAGRQSDSEGNYLIGISEKDPMMAGDTLTLELNVPLEEFLAASEYMHFRVNIPAEGLYRVDMKTGAYPFLTGRFEVHGTGPRSYRYLSTEDHGYILAEEGVYILSVAGHDLKSAGNFIIGIWEINAVPVALNDSLYVNMPETEQFHMYSIQPGNNTLLDCRFYQVGDPFLSGRVSLISPAGKILKEENLYAPDARIVSPLARDSMYYLEVERLNNSFDYVLLPGEDASAPVVYGDTVVDRLRYKGDKDLYHFDAQAGEVISLRGFQPDYQLSKGYFSLWNEAGRAIASRGISSNYNYDDYEIVYRIPETGTYSIIVGSHQDDTGSYQVILNQINPSDLVLNGLTELDVAQNTTLYTSFEFSGPKLIHFSITGDGGSGTFKLWDTEDNQLMPLNSNKVIYNFYSASYSGILNGGTYFVRIDAANAGRMYLNVMEAQPLSLDEKGKAAFADTIHQPHGINVYSLRGHEGDGVHAVLKNQPGETAPEHLELKYFKMSSAGSLLYLSSIQADYNTLEDSYLYESGVRLGGEYEDSIVAIVVTGSTQGSYHFELHHVAASGDITVDDDFAQYPEAQTSSHIAASYAIREAGKLTIANGVYTSMLPMKVEADYVILTGQEEENVLLRNVHNHSDNPVIYFYSESGSIGNLTLSCGTSNYYAIESLFGGITMDHIHIMPLEGSDRVAGGIKGGGDGMILTHITMTNSVWGIQLGSSGARIEDCDLLTENKAIELAGDNIVIRNNQIEVTSSNRAITTRAGYASSGSQLIEGNTIRMTREGYADGSGILNVENYTRPADKTSTVVRNNTIHSAGDNAAFYLTLGNPPSTITVENNSYYGTCPGGGKALMLQAGRLDGVSTIFVRNNTFSGLQSEGSITVYGAECINPDQRFAIYNNSFRLAADASTGVDLCFMDARASGYSFTDTSMIYLANNIFRGNGSTSLLKCSDEFSLYADYNTVFNFSSYLGGMGTLIGAAHDVTDDPLFMDDDLHVDPSSPVIDQGAGPDIYPGIPAEDKEGVARPQGGGYDMGAYER